MHTTSLVSKFPFMHKGKIGVKFSIKVKLVILRRHPKVYMTRDLANPT